MFLLSRNEQSSPTGNPDAGQDLYGLGVRIGFYLQSMGMVLHFYGERKDSGRGLKLASGSVTISILTSWFVFAAQKLFSPSEAIVVLLLLAGLAFPAKTTLLKPESIIGEVAGLITLLVTEMATCAALLWLFARLTVALPVLGTDNVVFFFAKVPIDGWFRYVALAISIIDAITSLNFAYKVIRVIKYITFPTGSESGPNEETIEKIIGWEDIKAGAKCLGWVVWALEVIAVELTIQWNHLSPTTDLQSPGQLIPLVTGIIIFVDSAYVVGRHVFRSHLKTPGVPKVSRSVNGRAWTV